MKPTLLQLSQIVTTAGTQIRAGIDESAVKEYADAMNDGAVFPPVVVFHDGSDCVLADGFHRVMAASRNGFKDIEADVRKGTKSDALKYALGANTTHGLKRTNADKRRSVELALAEWPKLSAREIARICAVSDPFVGEIKAEHQLLTVSSSKHETRVGKDGKTRKLPTKKAVAAGGRKLREMFGSDSEDRPHIIAEPLSSAQEATEAFKSLEPKPGDEDPFLDALIIAWEEAPKSSRAKFREYIS